MTVAPALRAAGPLAFDLERTSSAGFAAPQRIFGHTLRVYGNANLSIYVRQRCNARCAFCVEELRPLSRGVALADQRATEADDERYFARLDATLAEVGRVVRSVSVTGGEPSRDPSLPGILRRVAALPWLRRTMTTNGSGLWLQREGRPVIEHVVAAGLDHLNISRAHPDAAENARLMNMRGAPEDGGGLPDDALAAAIARAEAGGVAVRLSCVLLAEGVADLAGVEAVLAWAAARGVRSVIFRELMRHDPERAAPGGVARYSDRQRVPMRPLLAALDAHPHFRPIRQIVGYYYYVEVFATERYGAPMRVTFEAADLARIEAQRRAAPDLIHELIFHPNGTLCTTWQPWDGQLGPRA